MGQNTLLWERIKFKMATYPKSIVNFNRTARAINALQTRIPIVNQSFTANGNVPIIRDIPDEYRPPFSLKIGSYQGRSVVMAKRGVIRYTAFCLNTGTVFNFTEETNSTGDKGEYILRRYGMHILQDISIIKRGIIILENTGENTEFLQTENPDWVILDWAQMPVTSGSSGGHYEYRLEYAMAYEPTVEIEASSPRAHFALSITNEHSSERALWGKGYTNSEDAPVGIPLSYLDTSDKKYPYRDYGSNMDLTLLYYQNAAFLTSEYQLLPEELKLVKHEGGVRPGEVFMNTETIGAVKHIVCQPTPFSYDSGMTHYTQGIDKDLCNNLCNNF